jgi:hypothetical protein
MGYFSNGTEGMRYQQMYCYRCIHWDGPTETEIGAGCPIWELHEIYNNEDGWKRALNKLIPVSGIRNLQCVCFREGDREQRKEPPLRPGQEAALREWRERGVGAPASANPMRASA